MQLHRYAVVPVQLGWTAVRQHWDGLFWATTQDGKLPIRGRLRVRQQRSLCRGRNPGHGNRKMPPTLAGVNNARLRLGAANIDGTKLWAARTRLVPGVDNLDKFYVYYFTRRCEGLEELTYGFLLVGARHRARDPARRQGSFVERDYIAVGRSGGPTRSSRCFHGAQISEAHAVRKRVLCYQDGLFTRVVVGVKGLPVASALDPDEMHPFPETARGRRLHDDRCDAVLDFLASVRHGSSGTSDADCPWTDLQKISGSGAGHVG